MTVQVPGQDRTAQQPSPGADTARPGRRLPGWATVLVVIAHPDDESFGLGAIISQMTATGTAAHILCYTHGEASTLNENRAHLDTEREAELLHASTQLAAASVTLLGYPDGKLAAIPPIALAARAVRWPPATGQTVCSSSTTPASPVTQITRRPPAPPY
jgi:hypothetical protein